PVHDTDGGGATAPEEPPAEGQEADEVAPDGSEPVMPVMRHAEGNGDSGGPELLVKVPSRKWTRRAWGSERVMQPPTDWPGLVTDPDGLAVTAVAVDESELIGLDCETTSLDPRTGRVRLLTLATDRGTYLIDCFALDPAPLWEHLAERPLVLHNGLFDLQFLARLGFTPGGDIRDTLLLSQV